MYVLCNKVSDVEYSQAKENPKAGKKWNQGFFSWSKFFEPFS